MFIAGKLFVGGVKNIVQFDEELNVTRRKFFGKTFDHPKCYPSPVDCLETSSYVDNIVSVLLTNQVDQYVLACFTSQQGLCSVLPYSDITNPKSFADVTDTATYLGSSASSYAFFGSPPSGQLDNPKRLVYAAMATYDRSDTKFSPKTISTREVMSNATNWQMRYFYDNAAVNEHSYLNVFPSIQSRFRVKYIYGFELNGYGYFVSIQPTDSDVSRTEYVTRLVQFCLNDKQYKTYIETAIKCVDTNGINYTYATAAFIQKDENENTLSISFVKPAKTGSLDYDVQYGTRICNFSMKTVRDHFVSLREKCHSGVDGFYPWWIQGSIQKCRQQTGTPVGGLA